MEEVKQHPGDDHVVIASYQNTNHGRCDPHTAKIGTYCAPHVDGSLTKSLPNAELQVEDWDAFEDEHDEVGYQEGS